MKTNIYVLEKDDIQMFMDSVPEYVCENVSKEGYYTLGSVISADEGDLLTGMLQFYVDITAAGRLFGELAYVYIFDEFRRMEMGKSLVEKADFFLFEHGINLFVTAVPGDATDSHHDVTAGDESGSHHDVTAGDETGSHHDVTAGDATDSHNDVTAGDATDSHHDVTAGDETDSHHKVTADDETDSHNVFTADNATGSHYEVTSLDELGVFLRECGFIATGDKVMGIAGKRNITAGEKRYFKLSGR